MIIGTSKKDRLPLWYERGRWPYAIDKKRVDQLADWIRQVDWQLFCTFTFSRRTIDEHADIAFAQFINRLELSQHADVGYIRSDEKRFSGCGKPATSRHYHALLTSAAPLQPTFVEWLWGDVANNRICDDGAKVELYDSTRNGAVYALKMINQSEGDWKFGRLELFHPEARSLQDCRQRLRRHITRHKARLHKFAPVEAKQADTKIAIVCSNFKS